MKISAHGVTYVVLFVGEEYYYVTNNESPTLPFHRKTVDRWCNFPGNTWRIVND